jgi:hypothetical protein
MRRCCWSWWASTRPSATRAPANSSNGLWTVFIGLWLFAVFEGLFGLTFGNSWPLFIIISGITMAIRPIAERRFGPKGGDSHGQ